ncbi:MAG TPA: tetratricopeptide repeat protein [Terracidiphilus sp.]|jgi:tetratricopeptide (TPR) repeat protein
MKALAILVLAIVAVSALAQSPTAMPMGSPPAPGERLGTVSFPVSCSPSQQASFNRGVALLHDFWYAEARPQFEQIAKADPSCAMAHWGIAMSIFHQIWDRPDDKAMKLGWDEMQKAQSPAAKTDRERDYIDALAVFYKPGNEDFMTRVTAYTAAMDALYRRYPDDVDAGAFYALSLLASEAPNDTSLKHEHEAMAVLDPLFARYPDNPGVVHYIIHSCDNPAMAKDGLVAAKHYGDIAPSGPHAAHMPGHIFMRLGMWPQDIDAQLASIQASETAEADHENGITDEPHSYDFLMYAYLQSGQDANAKVVLGKVGSLLDHLAAMPAMSAAHRPGMIGYFQTKFPVFYAIETRDWQAASALKPVPGAMPEDTSMTWWARAIADGHLHHAEQAHADLVQYDALIAEVKKGPHAYFAEGTGTQIARNEIAAWASFAATQEDEAVKNMREAADLQDKVGQDEVDIPAREMLGDMLLELHQPQQALAEYRVALKLSPNRFNGLYEAGVAAEEAGDKAAASDYFAVLLKSTGDGSHSTRPELTHAKRFVATEGVVASQ